MRMIFLAAAAWVIYRIAQENSDDQKAPLALLSPPDGAIKPKLKRAVM